MTGPEHYAEAERLLAAVIGYRTNDEDVPGYYEGDLATIVAAQVHATLALTAATQPGGRKWAEVTRYEKDPL